MKKNITINLFGVLYAIDEDAYNLLSKYLDSMKDYFSRHDGGDEIADDIEHRVAELLWQKKQEGMEAIDIDTVREIISKIGDASQIDNEGEEAQPKTDHTTHDDEEAPRSDTFESRLASLAAEIKAHFCHRFLYRDPKDKMLGGVCSGLSQYTRWGTPLAWRLGTFFTTLFLMSFAEQYSMVVPFIYVVLWVLVPVPRTAEDHLKMRGQRVTAENLNEEILREPSPSPQPTQAGSQSRGCLAALLKVALIIMFLPALAALCGVIFAFIVVMTTLGGVGTSLFPLMMTHHMEWMPSVIAAHPGMHIIGLVALLVVLFIPIYALYRLIHRVNTPNQKSHALLLIIIWVVSLAIAIASLVSFCMQAATADQEWRDNHRHATKLEPQDIDTLSEETVVVQPDTLNVSAHVGSMKGNVTKTITRRVTISRSADDSEEAVESQETSSAEE